MNKKKQHQDFLNADCDPSLLSSRIFAPLFWCQFFSAFNNNFIKETLIFLIVTCSTLEYQSSLISLASGVFSLPYLLFSATGGQLADRYDKAAVARFIQFSTLFIALATSISLLLSSITLLMICLFLLGSSAALFGPIKYAILPDHMAKSHLPRANAWIEAATFVAILSGTLWASISFNFQNKLQIIPAIVIIVLAVISWVISYFMPKNIPAHPNLVVDHNIIRATISILKYCVQKKHLLVVSLIISWFWFIGAAFLSIIPILTAFLNFLPYGNITFLIFFSFFAAIGAGIAAWLSAGRIVLVLSVIGTFVLGIVCIDLGIVIKNLSPKLQVRTFVDFFSHAQLLHILVDFALIATFASLLVVPGFAALQAWANPKQRARVIAANNIINAAMIVVGMGIVTFIQYLGAPLYTVILMLGASSLITAIAMLKYLPTSALRDFIFILFRIFFRLEIKGIENFSKAGKAPIFIFNHVSFLDGFLAFAVCDTTNMRNPAFAICADITKFWWFRLFQKYINFFPIDPTHPLATRDFIRTITQGIPLVIFPEGRITITGSLMKVYDGTAMVADKTGAKIVPIKIDGLERTFFSRLSNTHTRRKLFPKVCITITEPIKLNIHANIKSRARRQAAGDELYRIMSDLVFSTSNKNSTLFNELVKAARNNGMRTKAIEDPLTGSMSYGLMLSKIRVLAKKLAALTQKETTVGMLLPNANSTALTFFALQSAGKVPAILDFSANSSVLLLKTKASKVRTIITTHTFLRQENLEETADILKNSGMHFIYLDDLKKNISKFDQLMAFCMRCKPIIQNNAQDWAVILFTSNSENVPKGVVLTHANILSNAAQVAARVDFNKSDKIFNVVPIFHSFGLTMGTILPLVYGVPIYFYPSPLHYNIIPEIIYNSNATIILGTDTFLNNYARNAHPYDLHSIRYCFSSIEPITVATRTLMMEKFGIRILEGYSVTEASSILALNTPMYNKNGTVGKLMPSLISRLESVENIEKGGCLYIKGPNIMAGYLTVEQPGVLLSSLDGWHNTGDIIDIDAEGFITILKYSKHLTNIN
ncbi:MFS transporter [Bartonella sp. A05]|uniref:MFS transporter n=1 Tax=Bartonella sp. A05 TaxID=2967261 RepID=UPI0022A98357|nr:MFS transporter [Bartonella sp. A05]MCZ2203506.1 MFS transporter [Bartonella sp. A05]